jgi:DNA-binding NarL/FixJ family response regulator
LLKKTPPARLLEYLRTPWGRFACRPTGHFGVNNLVRSIRPPEKIDYNLTPHEMRLLQLLMEGHNHKTAAAGMDVSFNTVAFRMKNVYEKPHVHSKSAAKELRSKLIG